MIIATIGHTSLKLESLKDAEVLFGIASRATLVEPAYDANYHRDYRYLDEGEKRITIEFIESDKILTFEEYQKIKAARAEKARKDAESDKGTQAVTA